MSTEKKTGVMRFLRPRGRVTINTSNFVYDGHNLELLNETKFLGVTLDSQLTFDSHADRVKRKIIGGVAALNRLRKLVPKECMMATYYAYVHSHLNYALEVYGMLSNSQTLALHRLQKRALWSMSTLF